LFQSDKSLLIVNEYLPKSFTISKLCPVTPSKSADYSWPDESAKYDLPVSSEEYEKIMQELAAWCVPRGRQQELADRLHVSKGLVSLWLRGKRQLSLEQWIAIKKIIRRKRK
jgi:hypothetical protein